MEHIDGCVISHDRLRVLEGCQEELIERLVCHVVVFDSPGAALVVDIVRRVGDNQVGLATCHQKLEGFRFRAVATDKAVPAQRPHITGLGDGRLLQLGGHIELIFVQTVFHGLLEEIINFRRLKAGEGHIEIRTLQIRNQQSQFVLVPVARDFIQSHIQCLFFFL